MFDADGNDVTAKYKNKLKKSKKIKKKSKANPKLPSIDMRLYFWNGQTATLPTYIKNWHKMFKFCSDREIIPHLKTLVPYEYHYLFINCKTFEQCLDQLKKRATCEDIHVDELKDKIRTMPKSFTLENDRIVLKVYLKTVAELMEVDDTAEIKASEVGTFFAKLSCIYTFKKNKEILERVKVKYDDLQGKLNYLPTFVTMLEDTLRIVENDLSTSKLV